jgi:hypothetical protein
MRCQSVGNIMNRKGSKGRIQNIPNEGSKIREVYDQFQASKGVPIEWSYKTSGCCGRRLMQDLKDYYGLDIRRIQSGSSKTGRKSLYVLAGEWFGSEYVDYIAKVIEK